MPCSILHNCSFTIQNRSGLGKVKRYVLLFLIILLVSFTGSYASTPQSSKQINDGNSTIVYKAESGNTVIKNGRITAVEGKTINLLPGTHIKSTEHLAVNIASKDCQQEVAREAAKEREEAVLAYSVERKKELMVEEKTTTPLLAFHYSQAEGSTSTIGQQPLRLAASLVNTTVSLSAPEFILDKKNLNKLSDNKLVSDRQFSYVAISSWGMQGETIKIMRC